MPVLVVDDVAVNRRLVAALLGRLGFAVDEAEGGREAVALVARHAYAAVLMDIEMPGMDGIAATRAIRALPGVAARTKVIALTAHSALDEREEAGDAGMDAFLVKPVSFATLAEVMATIGLEPA